MAMRKGLVQSLAVTLLLSELRAVDGFQTTQSRIPPVPSAPKITTTNANYYCYHGTTRKNRCRRRRWSLESLRLIPDHNVLHSTTEIILSKAQLDIPLPFQDVAKELSRELGIALPTARSSVPEEATEIVLGSMGMDLLIFLASSVLVTTAATAIQITPILGYLILGAILGPNGLDFFSNSPADVDLGDFGILFLLFSEGLEVSKSRLRKLANFLPLGMAQISLTTGIVTSALLTLGKLAPASSFLSIRDPIQACILAVTCTLSTSAFIFPVLKERGWEEEQSGAAATTILLLQDLLVAPLLVLLPYLVGSGPTDYAAIGFLTLKATVGFGGVIFLGSLVLQFIFRLVSQTRSSETFVALCLLVSAGMGEIAKTLGLTDTAGAFAAGVLLANTNYRAQIQADILPFKGILLGIFFMDAGSNFDLNLVLQEWPYVFGGSAALVAIKALTLFGATNVPKRYEPNRLAPVDGIRIAILLAGGGEFAFVVLALAGKIGVLSDDLIALLTAIVLVTMGITPILGDAAALASQPFVSDESEVEEVDKKDTSEANGSQVIQVAEDSIVVCGHAEAGRAVLRQLGKFRAATRDESVDGDVIPDIVAFSRNAGLAGTVLRPLTPGTIVLYGDGKNPEVIKSSGVTNPKAIYITYESDSSTLAATARLRAAFPDVPIYARASKRKDSRNLQLAGATTAIVEADELARAVPEIMKDTWKGALDDGDYDSDEDFRQTAASAAQIPLSAVDELFELYESLDLCATGLIGRDDIIEMFRKTKKGFVASDDEISEMESWLKTTESQHMNPLDRVEFCRLYARAPDFVKKSFGVIKQEKQEQRKS